MSSSSSSSFMAYVTPILMTLVATWLTLPLLYSISNLRSLWIALFVEFCVAVFFVKKLITVCCYEDYETNDLDQQTLFGYFDFAYMTFIVIISKLMVDVLMFLVAISPMAWYAYINIFAIIFTFAFVVIPKIGMTQ